MKKTIKYYFTFSIVIGTLIYLLKKSKVPLHPILSNYINDFLIIPIVLTICLFILKKTKNSKNYQLPLGLILYLCSMYAILFEYIFPKYLERYTADYIDVLLYFISGLIFYKLQKQ